ncbi:MAG: MFS transporter [Salinigranum sp.]
MWLLSADAFRGFRRPVYVVALGRLVNVFGSGLVYPFATLYFHIQVGIPLALIGLGLLANNVATAVATAVGGYLADRVGRRPVMTASMALAAPALAAYALVSTASGFVVVSTAAGLAAGLYTPAGQAMTADLAGDDSDRAFALLKVASNAGFGLGFVAGGVLYEVARTSVFLADGATSAVVAVLLALALPRVHGRAETAALGASIADWGRAITRPRIVSLAALNVGFAVMYAQMQATVPIVAKETLGLSAAQVGTLWVINPLVIVLFQLPLVAAVSGWRRTRGLAVSAGFWGVSMLTVLLASLLAGPAGVALLAWFLVLRTVGEILHSPLITALAGDLGRSSDRGSKLSLLEISKRLGFGLGATLGGAFFDAGLPHLLWPALAGVCVVVAAGSLALERRVSLEENGVAAA